MNFYKNFTEKRKILKFSKEAIKKKFFRFYKKA